MYDHGKSIRSSGISFIINRESDVSGVLVVGRHSPTQVQAILDVDPGIKAQCDALAAKLTKAVSEARLFYESQVQGGCSWSKCRSSSGSHAARRLTLPAKLPAKRASVLDSDEEEEEEGSVEGIRVCLTAGCMIGKAWQ